MRRIDTGVSETTERIGDGEMTEEFLAPDKTPIQLIEWYKHDDGVWRVTSVESESSSYDFHWCKQSGSLVYRDVGGGSRQETTELLALSKPHPVRSRAWSAKPIVDKSGTRLTNAEARALGYDVVSKQPDDPFDDANEGDVAWCTVCDSMVDTDDRCRHIHDAWDGNGYCWGAGAADLDIAETRKSFARFIRLLPESAVDCLKQILMSTSFSGMRHSDSLLGGNCQMEFRAGQDFLNLYIEPFAREPNFEERYMPGLNWLYSLDDKTREQNCLTVGWIWLSRQEHSGTRPLPLHVEVSAKRIAPYMKGSMEYVPDQEFSFTSKELSRCANTIEFEKDPRQLETIVLRTSGLKDRMIVEMTVGTVVARKGRKHTKYVLTPARIIERCNGSEREDIREKCKHLIASYWSNPETRKKRNAKSKSA